ncbi:MAG: DUF4197 domain-containing protein [Salinivirgaceae bacterium]|nr:DUF4197 domain-containing protein [Salinivirgaceae bacterium]
MKLKSAFKRTALAAMSLGIAITFTSCEELFNSESDGGFDTVSALKEALTIGAKTAATNLGQEGGYLNDVSVKIGVPDEVSTVMELASTEAGQAVLSALGAEIFNEGELVQLMNKAAETAAPESAEIFAAAITSMTIEDGENILFGAENAATEYLRAKTYDGLTATFGRVVTNTFDQVSVGGHTLNDAWAGFTQYYNRIPDLIANAQNGNIVKALAVKMAFEALKEYNANLYNTVTSIEKVNTNLGEYVTAKALDGLFVKVADKEKGIRTDASQRVSNLLQNVFGRLDNR